MPTALRAALSRASGERDPAFRVRLAAGGLVALNGPQRIRARFDSAGVILRSGALRVSLSQPSFGGVGLGHAAPRAAANLVTYDYRGAEEWYANGPLGLEQGFKLARPARGAPAASLTLAMTLSGNARARLGVGGRSVVLSHAGSSLIYAGLEALDAGGRTLPASLLLRGRELLITVDTRGARYPLRIDPLVQQGVKLTGGEQESGEAEFGYSVSLSGDGNTALVGAPRNHPIAGSVWVFVRSGGTWVQQGSPLNNGEPEPEKGQCEPEAEEGGN
ncbi:MAG TPA: FG-GAP repeat protein, partial [Solirubrobacteraceae bacterium]|nr:FG-GAP repeat protein [Solirubrobacteraceae bacterium]